VLLLRAGEKLRNLSSVYRDLFLTNDIREPPIIFKK
jgi:hypothetical protein